MDLPTTLIALFSLIPFAVMRITKKYFHFALLGVIAVTIHGFYLFGPKIIYLLLITFIISTIAELVSLKTPISVFGVKYSYNLRHSYFSSRINLLKVYPIEVSFTWVLLKYISFCMGTLISTAFSLSEIHSILLIPLILVSLDFIIDPVAVKAKMWKWEKGSPYFGIPIQNFGGWFIVGLVSSKLFSVLESTGTKEINYLYILPILFYALIVRNVTYMFKVDKTKATLGVLPGVIWIILSSFSLVLLLNTK